MSREQNCYGVLFRRSPLGHDDEAEDLGNTSFIENSHRKSGSTCGFTMDGSIITPI